MNIDRAGFDDEWNNLSPDRISYRDQMILLQWLDGVEMVENLVNVDLAALVPDYEFVPQCIDNFV